MNRHLRRPILVFVLAILIIVSPIHNVLAQNKKAYEQWKRDLKKSALPKNNVELQLKLVLAKDGQVGPQLYLKFPWGMTLGEKDSLYVSDWGGDKVLKFKMNGDFISSFGKTGQGPGDLFRPASIMIHDDRIIVHDSGNRRVVFFDMEGKYVKHFKIYKNYYEMVISDKGQFFAIPFFISKEHPGIVDVLDEEGHLIKSFGTFPKAIPCLREAWGHISIAPKREEIYVAYSHFLFVQKYDTDGKLQDEYRVDHPFMSPKEDENRKKIERISNPALYQVIDAIQGVEDGFFLLITYPRTEFLHFDKSGKFLMDYWYSSPWDAGAGKSFVVQNSDLDKTLFIISYEQQYTSILILEKIKNSRR